MYQLIIVILSKKKNLFFYKIYLFISFRFLESLESICTILPTALACLDSNEELRMNYQFLLSYQSIFFLVLAIQRLSDWALKLINIEYIMEKQFTELKDTLLKIRIIKCGIRLCGYLCVLTEDISNDWIVSLVFRDFLEN
jgi:hypothetical protein